MLDTSYFFFYFERIGNLLWIANYHYNKILTTMPQSISWEDDIFDEKVALLDLISDNIILQLYKFIETIPILRKIEEKTYSEHELTKSLEQLLQPLLNNEKKIRIWRNNLVAHAKSSLENKKSVSDYDPDYIKLMREIHLISRLVVNYIMAFEMNIPDRKLEMNSIDKLVDDVPSDHEFKKWWESMKMEEEKIINNVNLELKINGFDMIKKPSYVKFYE